MNTVVLSAISYIVDTSLATKSGVDAARAGFNVQSLKTLLAHLARRILCHVSSLWKSVDGIGHRSRPSFALFGVGCSRSRTSNVIFKALAARLNLEALNKAMSHKLPTLPDLYTLLGGYCSIMGRSTQDTGGSRARIGTDRRSHTEIFPR